MADNYEELARDIVEHVGGEENVDNLRHCITRLRFNLKDENKADTDYLKKRDGVVTVVKSAGQYQVVIGNEVANVYEAITEVSNIGEDRGDPEPDNSDVSTLDRFIDTLSGLFQPFLGVLAATGIIKGLVAILGAFGLNAVNSGFYAVLEMTGDGFFQFLPVVLTITAAKKFRMNQFTALAISATLLYPTLGALQDGDLLYTLFGGTAFEAEIFSTFLGIPIILPPGGSYYATVIPIILTIWFGSKIEKWVKSWMPKIVATFFTPLLTVLIAAPISLLLIGPLATWLSSLIGVIFNWLYAISPILFAALVSGLWQVLVIFGLHWGLVPIAILQLTELGYSTIFAQSGTSTFAIFGVLLAIFIKTKNQKTKQLTAGSLIPAFFGITEPAIYGVVLPMRTPFIVAIVANTITGLYNGIVGLVSYRMGGLGIFSIPNFIPSDGAMTMNLWHRLISFALATLLGFGIMMFLKTSKNEDEELTPEPAGAVAPGSSKEIATVGSEQIDDSPIASDAEMQQSAKEEIIASPVSGHYMDIAETADEVFSSGALGKGLTVDPTAGVVKAPTNGTVSALFETGHAIGITTGLGTEILIHIGLDTVELEGKAFTVLVEKDQEVVAGEELIHFDIDAIKEAGYSPVIPIVVTNTNDFTDILLTEEKEIVSGDYLLTTLR